MHENNDAPRICDAGQNGLLFDVAGRQFSDVAQERIWAVSAVLGRSPQVLECIPGMNNLLVLFDSAHVNPPHIKQLLLELWNTTDPDPRIGRDIEVQVTYGGSGGEDLQGLAEQSGMTIEEVVRLHSEATYCVSSIGAMPGFPYLSGLPERLEWSRRSVPRMQVQKGSVVIGGGQAGVMPITAPSGWHILGRTELVLFDSTQNPPNRLQLGDRIHFRVARIES